MTFSNGEIHFLWPVSCGLRGGLLVIAEGDRSLSMASGHAHLSVLDNSCVQWDCRGRRQSVVPRASARRASWSGERPNRMARGL